MAARGGEPLVVADGDELPLAPAEDGAFRVGKAEWSPERLRFDRELDGRAQLALLNHVAVRQAVHRLTAGVSV